MGAQQRDDRLQIVGAVAAAAACRRATVDGRHEALMTSVTNARRAVLCCARPSMLSMCCSPRNLLEGSATTRGKYG
eukprot:437757-Prymnesium_polylepis.1